MRSRPRVRRSTSPPSTRRCSRRARDARPGGAAQQASSTYFEEWYVPTDEGYFNKPGAPANPEAQFRPLLTELARRKSVGACVWLLGNTWATDEASKALLAECLDLVSQTKMDAAKLGEILLPRFLAHQPARRAGGRAEGHAMVAAADDKARAGLLYSLGMGLCETAGRMQRCEKKACGRPARGRRSGPRARKPSGRQARCSGTRTCSSVRHVPDFEATDVDGHAFHLSDYEGKVTVIDFWGFGEVRAWGNSPT